MGQALPGLGGAVLGGKKKKKKAKEQAPAPAPAPAPSSSDEESDNNLFGGADGNVKLRICSYTRRGSDRLKIMTHAFVVLFVILGRR